MINKIFSISLLIFILLSYSCSHNYNNTLQNSFIDEIKNNRDYRLLIKDVIIKKGNDVRRKKIDIKNKKIQILVNKELDSLYNKEFMLKLQQSESYSLNAIIHMNTEHLFSIEYRLVYESSDPYIKSLDIFTKNYYEKESEVYLVTFSSKELNKKLNSIQNGLSLDSIEQRECLNNYFDSTENYNKYFIINSNGGVLVSPMSRGTCDYDYMILGNTYIFNPKFPYGSLSVGGVTNHHP